MFYLKFVPSQDSSGRSASCLPGEGPPVISDLASLAWLSLCFQGVSTAWISQCSVEHRQHGYECVSMDYRQHGYGYECVSMDTMVITVFPWSIYSTDMGVIAFP
eukprot:1321933-Amorphochlora_amoeboformis.AAC.1